MKKKEIQLKKLNLTKNLGGDKMAYEPGDLAIKIDGYKLNIRAAGVIIHNGKILLHKGETANHYALLGGHVRIGENSQDTDKT